jgi:hypothetical protein
MPELKKFCDAMYASTPSRIVLANLAHDLIEYGRVDAGAIASILELVTRQWDEDRPGEFVPSATDARAATHLLDAQLDSGVSVNFCTGRPTTTPAPLSRIYEENVVFTYLLHSSAFGRPARRRGSGSRERLKIDVESAQVQHGAMITGRRPVAWATPTETIERLIETTEDREVATRVRDHLGLDTLDDPMQELVEVLYPQIPAILRAPTVIEGSCRKAYRSVEANGGWGRAVDLSTMEEGAPETVHPPIPFGVGFKVRFLGAVRDEPFTYTDEGLYDGCSRKWNPDEDVDRLRERCFPASP